RAPCSPFYGGDVRHEASRTCRRASLQRRRFWEEIHVPTTMHAGRDLDQIPERPAQLRVDAVRSSRRARSGRPTPSMSGADLLATLMARHLRYDWDAPEAPGNDHLVFSKGHASPLLYSVYKAAGVVSDQELMEGYRRFDQRLEGHPTPV